MLDRHNAGSSHAGAQKHCCHGTEQPSTSQFSCENSFFLPNRVSHHYMNICSKASSLSASYPFLSVQIYVCNHWAANITSIQRWQPLLTGTLPLTCSHSAFSMQALLICDDMTLLDCSINLKLGGSRKELRASCCMSQCLEAAGPCLLTHGRNYIARLQDMPCCSCSLQRLCIIVAASSYITNGKKPQLLFSFYNCSIKNLNYFYMSGVGFNAGITIPAISLLPVHG